MNHPVRRLPSILKGCLLGALTLVAGCLDSADAQPVPRPDAGPRDASALVLRRPDGGARRLNRHTRANLRILAILAEAGTTPLSAALVDSFNDTRDVSGLGTYVVPTGDAGAVGTMAGQHRRRLNGDAGARPR